MSRRSHRALAALALLAAADLSADPAAAEQTGRPWGIVTFGGSVAPRLIPRDRPVPVSIELSGSVHATDGARLPQLSRTDLAFGARGGLETAGLPVCPRARLRNATARQALARCRGALIGRGEISTEVPLDPEKPLLARAGALAFNGRSDGRPAVWVHAYSASPPVAFVLPFHLRTLDRGAFGILLRSPVREALGPWPRLRSFGITLGRRYRAGGERRSYLSARCPLPPRFNSGIFPLARATYHFGSRSPLSTTILRGCRVRR